MSFISSAPTTVHAPAAGGPQATVRLLVGGQASPQLPDGPGHAIDALVAGASTRRLLSQLPTSERSTTVLLLVEAASAALSQTILERLTEIIPIVASDSTVVSATATTVLSRIIAQIPEGPEDLHISAAAITWPRLRVLFTGANRHVLIRGNGHSAMVLTPRAVHSPALVTSSLVPGDWVVLLARTTSDAIHLSGTGLAVRDAVSPHSVCTKLVSSAAHDDPSSHHAVVALAVR
jgi:hypothetical protein